MTPTPVGMRCPECSRERTPVKTMRSLQREPVVTYVLIAISVLAWVAELATGAGASGGGTVFAHGALFGPAIDGGHEYWRLVTSAFLHLNQLPSGIIHIGFNMYLLWYLGRLLEPSIGRIPFLVIYFAALLCGSFGALLLTPDSSTVGASGAVFGLMGAAVVVLRARGIDPWQAGIGPLILLNLLFSFAIANVSIGGHIGGLVGGAAAAYLLEELPARWRRVGLPACLLLAVAAVGGALAVAGGVGMGGG
ncbi:MAG: rhomboid family intramembrane serine protease [Actinomycetota bacterium]|nr:rhomboid family intramembrane serine protease [Actinomycetota bacterium]